MTKTKKAKSTINPPIIDQKELPKNEIILKLEDFDFKLGVVASESIDGLPIDEEMQKKSFLYSLFAGGENESPKIPKVVLTGYLAHIIEKNCFEDKIFYSEKDGLIYLDIEIEKDVKTNLAILKVAEFNKLKTQVGEGKIFKTLKEGIIHNLFYLFNTIDNEEFYKIGANFLFLLIIGKEGVLDKNFKKEHPLDLMSKFFVKRTFLK